MIMIIIMIIIIIITLGLQNKGAVKFRCEKSLTCESHLESNTLLYKIVFVCCGVLLNLLYSRNNSIHVVNVTQKK